MYWGFKEGLRDLLGLDGCFMKGQYSGQLLTAVGIDANHEDDLDLNPMSNFTFISNRQKGILPVIAQVFPCADRFCVRHIYENFKAQWKGNQFKELVWRCAAATTVPYFDRQIEKLKSLDEGDYEYLKKRYLHNIGQDPISV
ncbi:hypothetical protein Tco_0953578 [Tanacetum coccineum]|uniref:MULE transposase domain-containing protein n=1 Tax=Tanacetum coccineum TaxID=301880 RepID=A0ABQ5E2Z7_9ASTR